MKAQDYADLGFEALAAILDDWHPAIAKAIAETWGMSDELAKAGEPLDAGLYPVLQRLGVARAGEKDVKLTEHAEQISNIRGALIK